MYRTGFISQGALSSWANLACLNSCPVRDKGVAFQMGNSALSVGAGIP